MAGTDLVSAAIAELYAGDPEDFIKRRRDLAAQARSAGNRDAAKTIAGLGKPTRSAWIVNRLVHADPGVAASLAELGGRLRSGEAALDGASIRELSRERRELVDGLVRRALNEAGQSSASVALRDEVTDTFNAALADPDVGEQVAAGTLQKAVHWAGFGPGIGSAVSSGPARAPAARAAAAPDTEKAQDRAGPGRAKPSRAGSRRTSQSRAGAKAQADPQAHAEAQARADAQVQAEAQARAEREREEGLALVASAEQDAEEAARAADAAAATEREINESVTFMQERLNREQQRLVEARRDTRQAAAAATRAKQTLDRLRRRFSS
ncbi:MAG TPA: hypothetical protein VFW16_11840 [Streptosporangiaceae bacterium]|nr:hypothetical protein [Streptosporangiaceae bacterium]